MPLSSGSLAPRRRLDLGEFVLAWNGSGTGRSGCARSAQPPASRAACGSAPQTPYHKTHIALHELAHMLLDHRGATRAWERLVNLLVPDVDPQLIQLVLGRSMYTTEEERDADHLQELGLSAYSLCCRVAYGLM